MISMELFTKFLGNNPVLNFGPESRIFLEFGFATNVTKWVLRQMA